VRVRGFAFLLLSALIAGCSPASSASFDASAPCTADARLPGAYAELEALIPRTFEGRAPTRLDSGRNCTPPSLGTLAAAGFREIHFAGGLWELGQRSGVTLAVLAAHGLTAEQVIDFYEAGARSARKTENVKRGVYDFDGVNAVTVETLNDESFQTIVAWQAPQANTVRVALVASDVREVSEKAEHQRRIDTATRAFLP
jgi:hypothetical protein